MRFYLSILVLLFLTSSCGSSQNIASVEELDLSGKWLKKIPLRVLKYKNLKKINLSDNNFKRFPAELSELKQIQTILLSGNNIDSLSTDEILSFKKLEVLDLDGNKIRVFPNLDKLNSLRIVTIIENELVDVKDLACMIPQGAVLVHGHEFSVNGKDCERPR